MTQFTVASRAYTLKKVAAGNNSISYVAVANDLPIALSPRIVVKAETNKSQTAAIIQTDIIIPIPKKTTDGRFEASKDVLRETRRRFVPLNVVNSDATNADSIYTELLKASGAVEALKMGYMSI